MTSDRIENRITDLLKLTGVSESNAIEELTDHYLSHIEEEIKRGVNAQQAIRETYQEIANLDTSQFKENLNSNNKRAWLLFFLLFVGIGFHLLYPKLNASQEIVIPPHIDVVTPIIPPSGSPILQSNLKVSSEFGLRTNPLKKQRELHKGIDICAKIGTEVLSTGNGIVKEAGYKPQAGNYITIQHNGNFTTKYYHLSAIDVASNEEVKEGQVIGKVGNSGLSLMPHLHYEVLKDEVPVNPREFIEP